MVTNVKTTQGALHKKQLESLSTPTPEDQIRSRPSGWGGALNYISGEYTTRRLMTAFNGGHRITILNQDWKESTCITTVRLEYQLNNGEWGRIDEVGSSTAKRDTKYEELDFGNTAKASMTDAVKRAGMRLGIGLDLYEKSPQQMTATTTQGTGSSFHKTGAKATDGQLKFLLDLAVKANPEWDVAWLSEITGIPETEFGEGDNPCSELTRNLASAAIESLKEIAYAKN